MTKIHLIVRNECLYIIDMVLNKASLSNISKITCFTPVVPVRQNHVY